MKKTEYKYSVVLKPGNCATCKKDRSRCNQCRIYNGTKIIANPLDLELDAVELRDFTGKIQAYLAVSMQPVPMRPAQPIAKSRPARAVQASQARIAKRVMRAKARAIATRTNK